MPSAVVPTALPPVCQRFVSNMMYTSSTDPMRFATYTKNQL